MQPKQTSFSQQLLAWFEIHGRKDLPWQQDVNPFSVWVSEIMLQQTQVKTVIPYFSRFMEQFPSIEDLAKASEDEVLHFWTGLGYYSRARNLHKTAKLLVDGNGAHLPSCTEELEQLPGIGRSTAGAIVALALNKKASILDGNVKRVLSRAFAIPGYPGKADVSKALWELSQRLTPDKRVAQYTQAIMDLGATVCTRSAPACNQCPLLKTCEANKTDSIHLYPGKKKSKKMPVKSVSMLIITNHSQEILLEKRPNAGIWGGLWGFPEFSGDRINDKLSELKLAPELLEVIEKTPTYRHTFTHFHLDISPVYLRLKDENANVVMEAAIAYTAGNKLWFHPRNGEKIGLTAPVTKLLGL